MLLPSTQQQQQWTPEHKTEEQSEMSTAFQVSTIMDSETQMGKFHYPLDTRPNGYKAPDKVSEKGLCYAGLPSSEILLVMFEHVTKYVTRLTQSLN